ncbi:hypothetical protein GOBAR_DD26920 [Gossypium barbadense]|nr:hypothetical protein GOBAR_DD26920 [Gossypium barbadense]
MVLNCHVNEAALVLPKNVTVTAVFVFGDSIVDPAEEFGVKESVPAYLDPKTQLQDLLTGVSFASGAAGYDPLTAKTANVIAMSGQLELFKECIKKIKGAVGLIWIRSKKNRVVGVATNRVCAISKNHRWRQKQGLL